MTIEMNEFRESTALITGGSSGIGLSMARILVASGANVCILGRRKEVLQSAQAELDDLRINSEQWIDVLEADVSSLEGLSSRIMDWVKDRGFPHLLVNSAGISRPGLFVDLPRSVFDEMMSINYSGTVNTTRIILPGMLQRASGHIVNISSVAGFLGTYGYTAYGASKFAVRGFSDALRSELISTGVGITIVFPPDTNTPQLDAEEQYKPPVTKVLAETAGVLEPEFVAVKILRTVIRKKYICTPGFETAFLFSLSNLLGKLTYPVMDLMVKDAIKKVKSK